ncbi:MAG: serine protease [Planctomycetota bacterium]|nr:serine protease [Planctomycetota bacterium]
MKLISTIAAVAAALALSGAPGEARAEGDIRATARALAAKSSKAVVTVELVVSIKGGPMGGGDEEQEIEVVGTVIDPSGLTVVSASELDPTTMIKALLGGMGGMFPGGDLDSVVKETLIVLEDGTEFEADVVLKDADLDLAFIRPRDTDKKFDWIDLKPRTEPIEMLEEIFVLSRLGRLQNRVPALSLGTVKAIVKGPRTFYICDGEASSGSLGSLAFDSAGQPLGLFVMKQAAGGGGPDSAMAMGFLSIIMGAGSNRSASATILRSIEDVLEIAEQAKAAKVPEKEEADAEDDGDEEGEMEEPESEEEEESDEDDEDEEEEEK